MAIEVFNRYEKKYLISSEVFAKVQNEIKEYMEPDKFSRDGKFYSIANIYYDTDNDELIRNSIEKPEYKEKLRLRSYGVPELSDMVFLEIKKKYKGIVNKRRTRLKLSEAYELVENKGISEKNEYINTQVLKEIEYFLKVYNLVPKVYLSYNRMAFFEKGNGDLRITFDTDIRSRRYDLGLEMGNHGDLLIGNDLWLMEVKSSKGIPLWFVDILNKYDIYPSSFSKYGTEYKKSITESNNKGEKILCSRQFLKTQEQLHLFQLKEQQSA